MWSARVEGDDEEDVKEYRMVEFIKKRYLGRGTMSSCVNSKFWRDVHTLQVNIWNHFNRWDQWGQCSPGRGELDKAHAGECLRSGKGRRTYKEDCKRKSHRTKTVYWFFRCMMENEQYPTVSYAMERSSIIRITKYKLSREKAIFV